MKAPVHRLKKIEIIWLANNYCKVHKHDYLQHYSCFLKENPNQERVGFLDIEASNLDADFGIMLSYCIKDANSSKIWEGIVDKKGLDKYLDKQVVTKCIEDMQKFDRVVTYYGMRFDLPFIRTRSIVHGIDFPNYSSLVHTDVYFMARNKLKLSSNRLENVSRIVLGETNKTRIDAKYWVKALRGDKKSLNYILEHNRYDVIDLEKVYNKLLNFSNKTNTSI